MPLHFRLCIKNASKSFRNHFHRPLITARVFCVLKTLRKVFETMSRFFFPQTPNHRSGLLPPFFSLVHGFAFAIVPYAITNVSGEHLNPAITAAFRATRRISNINALAFISAQLIGPIIGADFLRLCLPASSPAFITLGSLTDSEPGFQACWPFCFWSKAAFFASVLF